MSLTGEEVESDRYEDVNVEDLEYFRNNYPNYDDIKSGSVPNIDVTSIRFIVRLNNVDADFKEAYSNEILIRGIRFRMRFYHPVVMLRVGVFYPLEDFPVDTCFRLLHNITVFSELGNISNHGSTIKKWNSVLNDEDISYLIDWREFLNPAKKYVINRKAKFEIELSVKDPKPC